FDQGGGAVTATGSIMIGGDAVQPPGDGLGIYSMHAAAGTLTADRINVGFLGDGTMLHTSGRVNAVALLLGATSSTVVGFYQLAGTGNVNLTGNLNVGFIGNGTFVQNGGTNTVGGTLFLGLDAGGKGSYQFAG